MGFRNGRFVIAVLAFFMLGVGSAGLNGQIGGFIKKRVKDVVKDPGKTNEAAAEQPPAGSGPRFNDRVLELNAANLAKLEKALSCEKDFRASVNAKYAKLPTREQHQECMIKVMMSPEVQALVSGNNPDPVQMSTKLMAIQEKNCGKDPERAGETKNQELKNAREEGAKCAGLTLTQYSIAMERIAPFCNSGGQSKIKGDGNVYWVYSPDEVSAIQPNCSKLSGLISGLNSPSR